MISILVMLFLEIYAKSNGINFLSKDAYITCLAFCLVGEFFWILAVRNKK